VLQLAEQKEKQVMVEHVQRQESFSAESTPLGIWKEMIDHALDRYLVTPEVEPQVIHQAMRYAVLNGGSRWRPLLTLLATDACSRWVEDVIPAACAFELIHCSSLILDDLPCMDNAELRRGVPTCHKVFGEAITIMTSIALLSLAHQLVLKNCQTLGVPSPVMHRLCQDIFALTEGRGMIAGQVRDLQQRGQHPSAAEVSTTHHHKSALLYVCAVKAGALLAGASEEVVAHLELYATQLGLAYQIRDDVCDVEGSPEELGKAVGMDLGKTTFVSLHGLTGAKNHARYALRSALQALDPLGGDANRLRELASRMVPLT
jgi:geranylgeranyl diphosphate synthase type II